MQVKILNEVKAMVNTDTSNGAIIRKMIANQLGISKTVAKEHVETLLVKLDAANRTEAVAIAIRKRLVQT